MARDGALFALHSAGVVVALVAALLWPRPGQAALLMPLVRSDLGSILRWAEREDAALLSLDTTRGRVIARMPDNRSLFRALGAGLVPVAARSPECTTDARR